MPFKSEKQRRWMWANNPEMAEEWEAEEKAKKEGKLMKITKQYLRRIIKEEKRKILRERHPDVEEGISRGTHEGIWNWLEAEFDQAMTGEDVWLNTTYTESIADALEQVAKEVRDRGAEGNPEGGIG